MFKILRSKLRKVIPCNRCKFRLKNHYAWNCKKTKDKFGDYIPFKVSLTKKPIILDSFVKTPRGSGIMADSIVAKGKGRKKFRGNKKIIERIKLEKELRKSRDETIPLAQFEEDLAKLRLGERI